MVFDTEGELVKHQTDMSDLCMQVSNLQLQKRSEPKWLHRLLALR